MELDLERFREPPPSEGETRWRRAGPRKRPGCCATPCPCGGVRRWGGVGLERFAQTRSPRSRSFIWASAEERVEAELALGQARRLVGELGDLVARHPLRERQRGELMLALYRSSPRRRRSRSFRASAGHFLRNSGWSPARPSSSSSSPSWPATRLDLPAPPRRPSAIGAAGRGPPAAAPTPAGGRESWWPGRWWLALVLVGVVVESSGGRAAPVVIPADAVGDQPLRRRDPRRSAAGDLPVVGGRRRWVGVGGQRRRGDGVADRPARRTPWCRRCRWARAPAGSRSAPGAVWVADNWGEPCRGSTRPWTGSCRRSRSATGRRGGRGRRARYGWPTQRRDAEPDRPRQRRCGRHDRARGRARPTSPRRMAGCG